MITVKRGSQKIRSAKFTVKMNLSIIFLQVELLLQLVSETLPSHLSEEAEEEEQEGEEREGEGDQEQEGGEEEAAAPDTGGQDN